MKGGLDTVSGHKKARGVNDGNQMQILRIERVWTRMSIRPGWSPSAWNREPVHLVRIDRDRLWMSLQPDKET